LSVCVFAAAHLAAGLVVLRDALPYLVLIQIIAMYWTGKFIVLARLGGVLSAAFAAVALILLVHVGLEVLYLVVVSTFGQADGTFEPSIRGVWYAFLGFSPVMFIIGYTGAVIGRRRLRNRYAAQYNT
jgi:cell division protein FtsX